MTRMVLALAAVILATGCAAKPAARQSPPTSAAATRTDVVIELRVLTSDASLPATAPSSAELSPNEAAHLTAAVKPGQGYSISSSDGKWTYTAAGRVELIDPGSKTYRVTLVYAASSIEGRKGVQTTYELKPGQSFNAAGLVGNPDQVVLVKLVEVE